MGSRSAQRDLVLGCEHWLIYSLAARHIGLAMGLVQASATSAQVLSSFYFLFSHSQPDQSSALGMGQHQNFVPLVCGFSAAGGMAAGAMVAATFLRPMAGAACIGHSTPGWRARRV